MVSPPVLLMGLCLWVFRTPREGPTTPATQEPQDRQNAPTHGVASGQANACGIRRRSGTTVVTDERRTGVGVAAQNQSHYCPVEAGDPREKESQLSPTDCRSSLVPRLGMKRGVRSRHKAVSYVNDLGNR